MPLQRASDPVLILTRREVAALMPFADYVAAVEEAFALYAEGKALSPGVLELAAQGGTFHAKAAGLPLGRVYVAVKVNGNFPDNPKRLGLPTIQGTLVLCDGATGSPLAFMDAIEVTLQRTAAATAVGAKHLARTDSATATVVGCGAQGRAQLVALKHALPLTRAYAFDLDAAAARRFASEMARALDLEVVAVDRLRDAARRSDAVVTCTTARRPVLGPDDVAPGTFVAAVGADSHGKHEIDPQLMARATVVVDVLAQCARIGDLHHALNAGALTEADVHAELGEVVVGRRPGRTSPEEIVVLDTTGTAIQDVAAAAAIYERARRAGAGLSCELLV